MEKAGTFGQEKRTSYLFTKSMSHKNIGVEGFEPPAPWSQTTCATKLRYTSKFYFLLYFIVAGVEGLEPPAHGFGDRRSTN